MNRTFRKLTFCVALLLLSGCATRGVIVNAPISPTETSDSYSIGTIKSTKGSAELSLLLTFSGGGTRAASLAYGVLEELRDTTIEASGQQVRLLDEIDAISSVSGGSFTSAYYGLYGEAIFTEFEDVFLRQDVQNKLINTVLNPLNWFSDLGRTDLAVSLYEEHVFRGATFADIKKSGGPLILINASDLGHGVRFSFIQEYFDLLCSDISTFPVARAVTASSSVPVVFNPVVIQNYPDCQAKNPEWLASADRRSQENQELALVFDGLQGYINDPEREYVHLVDGGITDNLGLRAIYEIVEISGGIERFIDKYRDIPPRRLAIISVDASTDPELAMDSSRSPPSLNETISSVSNAQLHRYNVATLNLIENAIARWSDTLSTPTRTVQPYFIKLRISDTGQQELLESLNRIPTSFALSDAEVDLLIKSGHELLRQNPDYQRLIKDLEKR